MKCNSGTNLVCTYWEKCKSAWLCPNVPQGIRKKLSKDGDIIKCSSCKMSTKAT